MVELDFFSVGCELARLEELRGNLALPLLAAPRRASRKLGAVATRLRAHRSLYSRAPSAEPISERERLAPPTRVGAWLAPRTFGAQSIAAPRRWRNSTHVTRCQIARQSRPLPDTPAEGDIRSPNGIRSPWLSSLSADDRPRQGKKETWVKGKAWSILSLACVSHAWKPSRYVSRLHSRWLLSFLPRWIYTLPERILNWPANIIQCVSVDFLTWELLFLIPLNAPPKNWAYVTIKIKTRGQEVVIISKYTPPP